MTKQVNIATLKKDFKEILTALSYGRTQAEVFRDWLEISVIAIHQLPYHMRLIPRDEAFETYEAEYREFCPKYKDEEFEQFAQLSTLTYLALNIHKTDFLGQLYMEMEIGGKKGAKGKIFTSDHISRSMAEVTLQGAEEIIAEKGYITISEPCSSAGGMLIAVYDLIEQRGYDPRKVVMFEAIDINYFCSSMTYIQTSILGLVGTVLHGDNSRQEIWKKWHTPSYLERLGAKKVV